MVEPKFLQFNYEKSLEVYNTCKEDLEIKHCYNNTFHVVQHYYRNFTMGKWKVVYGYVQIWGTQNLYCRHAFVIDEDDTVIDATLFTKSDKYPFNYENEDGDLPVDRQYISMKIFDDLRDYVTAISDNDGYPDLCFPLRELDQEFTLWAMDNNYFLCG